ncbi:hypothetical protein L3X38_022210 [Prunus dulcis]|uniref:Reverse transcriptase domain-containing protein n=1 Tax=Prunus dulcis TaxID=3755 RepID=A0AAD4VXH9_PRUDU|nr:hypothetical protein L3X38_022210 [Prunus dulcis]
MSGTSNNTIKHYVHPIYDHQVFSTEQGRLPKTQKSGWAPITFCEEEERSVILPYYDPLIIHADISNFDVGRILVDTGSSVSMMFADAFNELQVPAHLFDRSITPFVSFSSDVVQLIGNIHLPISIGSAQQRATVTTLFLIVDYPTTYNVILRRPALSQMNIFISTHMLLLKFPIPYGTGTKRHAYDPERYEAMKGEVDKLSSIGFINEVDYPTWLANLVMIFLHRNDQARISFITDRGLYCYKVMPFWLKNAGATYTRFVNSLFALLIGNTMEVYVDDMLVKSCTAD